MDERDSPAAFDGNRLRDIRELQGFSRQQLAALTEPPLSRAYVYLLEGDPSKPQNPRRPSYEVVLRLAKALRVEPSAFAASATTAPTLQQNIGEIPAALAEAADRFRIPADDVAELASFSFRSRVPQTARGWAQIWTAILNALGIELPE